MVDIKERFIKLQLEQSPESEKFLRHLICKGLITMEAMRQYCIVKSFPNYLKCNKGVIKDTYYDLADDFGIFHGHARKIYNKYARLYD